MVLPVVSALAVTFAPIKEAALFRQTGLRLSLFLSILFLGGVCFFWTLLKRSPKTSLVALCACLTVVGISYHSCYMPVISEHFKSPQLILSGANRRPIYVYGFNSARLLFYASATITVLQDLGRLKDTEPNALLIADDKAFIPVDAKLAGVFSPIKRTRYEKSYFTLYRRTPDTRDRFANIDKNRGG